MNPFRVAFIGRKLVPASRELEFKITSVLCELLAEKEFLEIHISRDSLFGDVCTLATSMAGRRSTKSNFSVILAKSYPIAKRFFSFSKKADFIFSFVSPDEEIAEAVRLAKELGKTVVHLEKFPSLTLDKHR